jgi:hypothetical protein
LWRENSLLWLNIMLTLIYIIGLIVWVMSTLGLINSMIGFTL